MSVEELISAAVNQAVSQVLDEVRGLHAKLAAIEARMPPTMGSVADAARILGVSQLTVRRQIAAGGIPARKVGTRVIVDLASLRPA